jgi:hypothetical protein
MTRLVTIAKHSLPVPPLQLTADDARKLGALLIADAEAYDRHHEDENP